MPATATRCRPILFDTAHWMSSALRVCSLEARGLWADLLCLMRRSPVPGQLRTDTGTLMGTTQVARVAGVSTARAEELLAELAAAGISKTIDGCLVCEWMLENEGKRTYERDRKRSQRERSRPPQKARDRDGDRAGTETGTTEGHFEGQTQNSKMGVGGGLSLLGGSTEKPQLPKSEVQRLAQKKNQDQERAQGAAKTRTDFPGFDAFWDAYPKHHKVGKPLCLDKWRKRGLELLTQPILDGLERWKKSDRWARGFVCDPHTFLNQRRWEDESKAAEPNPNEAPDRDLSDLTPEQRAHFEAIQRERYDNMTTEERAELGVVFTPHSQEAA